MSRDTTTLSARICYPANDLVMPQRIRNVFKSWLTSSTDGLSSRVLVSYKIEEEPPYPVSTYSDETSAAMAVQFELPWLSKSPPFLRVVQNWNLTLPLEIQNLPAGPRMPRSSLRDVGLRIGNMIGEGMIQVSKSIPASRKNEVVFLHSQYKASIFFDTYGFSKMQFSLRDVRRLHIDLTDSARIGLCFHLKMTPLLYTSSSSWETQRSENPELEMQDADMQRSLEIPTLWGQSTSKEFGRYMAYYITAQRNDDDITVAKFVQRLIRRITKYAVVSFCAIRSLPVKLGECSSPSLGITTRIPLDQKNFDALVALESCLSYSDELRDRLSALGQIGDFTDLVISQLKEDSSKELLQGALEKLCFSIENGDLIDPTKALRWLLRSGRASKTSDRSPAPGTCYLRRAFVTPSRVIIRPAELHTSNRILRTYDTGYALRVSFRDDDFKKLTFECADLLLAGKVVKPILTFGLQILDRNYEFLAASSSQLRDHGLYLYARDPMGRCSKTIRDEIGNFSSISNVGKKMARMGQALSSTQETVPIRDDEFQVVEDVTHNDAVHPISRKPFCFSDGIGTISSELMAEVCKILDWKDNPPSAIQVRFRGCKGMLCLDPRLPGRKLQIRRSMEKFVCPSPPDSSHSWYLEVIKRSAPTPLYLNRQLIPLLEYKGIDKSVFLRLALHTVLKAAASLVDERVALEYLSAFVKTQLPFKEMHCAGWDILRDPFINKLLYHLLLDRLKYLEEKARIMVPLNSGRNMLGVMDETGILDYGQVFIQYSWMEVSSNGEDSHSSKGISSPGQPVIVTGDVLVSKCPCVHPGDVRVLRAVDIPDLRHIKDCIVFPSRGPQPHPSEMAGSDLDGDEYIVIWHKDLVFNPDNNSAPFCYSDKPADLPRSFELEDEIQFFVNYIVNDMIGVASNAHLALSDQRGVAHESCIALVEIISCALDFAKTGRPARLLGHQRANKYPDFMLKSNMHSYKSKMALGDIYRFIRKVVCISGIQLSCGTIQPIKVGGWQDYEDYATRARDLYVDRLYAIMNQHGIQSEAEIFTGTISRVNHYNAFKSDYENVERIIEKQRQHLFDVTRKEFFENLHDYCLTHGVVSANAKEFVKMQMASAWFMAVYGESVPQDKRIFSFAWSIAPVLVQTLKWLNDQQPTVKQFTHSNVLLRALEESIAGEETLARGDISGNYNGASTVALKLLREWVTRNPDLKSLANCQCFDRSYYAYEQQIKELNLSQAGKVLDALRRLSLGIWPVVSKLCFLSNCDELLSAKNGTLPRIASYAARQLLELSINKDLCCFGLPCTGSHHETVSDYDEDTMTFDVETPGFVQLIRSDTRYAKCLERLRQWTGIPECEMRLRRQGRRKRPQFVKYKVEFHFAGSFEQRVKMSDVLNDENFEYAFVNDRKDFLKLNQ